MYRADIRARAVVVLTWCSRAAVTTVMVVAVVNLLGWVTRVDRLTRVYSSWAPMAPWSAVLFTALGAAVWLQLGDPSVVRVWVARFLAAMVIAVATAFLIERIRGRQFAADLSWLGDYIHTRLSEWPDRPARRAGVSMLFLAIGIGLTRFDRRWTPMAWLGCLLVASVTPLITVTGHIYKVLSEVHLTSSTGQPASAAVCVLLLVGAVFATRSDRQPVAWLLARPDRWSLLRLGVVVAGLPVMVGLWRLPFLALGLGSDAAWILSTLVATFAVGAVAFYLSQREQGLLIEKERLSGQRAEAEARYRILADNAVDVIVHLRGSRVAWISPSVMGAFGTAPQLMIGSDFSERIHPDDVDLVTAARKRMTADKPALERFRVRHANGNYHWVEGHGKAYVDANGNTDGLIAALRIVDDKVAAEQQLELLARYDTLTGLVNRAETIARFNKALADERSPGAHLGVLFCDIDHFKNINDTWGHLAGDVVLSTIAARVRVCVRDADTVGRLGGDEILVLLNGVHDLDEVVMIAEKIRCRASGPIHLGDEVVRATVSIGATLANPNESVYSMMARADVAMYKAKRAGRDTVTRI